TALDARFMELIVKRKTLAVGFAANHPLIKELDETLDLIKKMYGRGAHIGLTEAGTPLPPSQDGSPAPAPVEMDTMEIILAAMRAQMDSMKMRLLALEDQFQREQKDALALTTFQIKLQRKK